MKAYDNMSKAYNNLMKKFYAETREAKLVVTLTILSFIYLFVGVLWIIPQDVEHTYQGIRLQSGNPEYQTVTIHIAGEYQKRFPPLPRADRFDGTIRIESDEFTIDSGMQFYGFDSYRSFTFNWDTLKGSIHASQNMKEIVLVIATPSGRLFTDDNWYIAGPAETREEAVKLVNKYLEKFGRYAKYEIE